MKDLSWGVFLLFPRSVLESGKNNFFDTEENRWYHGPEKVSNQVKEGLSIDCLAHTLFSGKKMFLIYKRPALCCMNCTLYVMSFCRAPAIFFLQPSTRHILFILETVQILFSLKTNLAVMVFTFS